MDRRPAELLLAHGNAREFLHHHWPRDEGVGLRVMITWSTRPSIRAGPDTVGPLTMAIEGTTRSSQ